MNYKGKLFGIVGGEYFDTGKTSADWDALEMRVKELELRFNQERPAWQREADEKWADEQEHDDDWARVEDDKLENKDITF